MSIRIRKRWPGPSRACGGGFAAGEAAAGEAANRAARFAHALDGDGGLEVLDLKIAGERQSRGAPFRVARGRVGMEEKGETCRLKALPHLDCPLFSLGVPTALDLT